jgi:catechol 2,3-dioxygenase-like lactoylglutathione lyase family enzyme
MTFTVPDARAGLVPAITISSPDPDASLVYYSKLGFLEVQRLDFPYPWILITDHTILILLRQAETPEIALSYFVEQELLPLLVAEYHAAGIVFTSIPTASDMVPRYVFESPDDLQIALVPNFGDVFQLPEGPTMLRTAPADFTNPDKYVNKTLGMFAEFAQPVADLEQSIAFWQKIGFSVLSKTGGKSPWSILSDGHTVVGLHQAADFSHSTITYFASDMAEKIQTLKTNGLDNYKEKGDPANIELTTPEQQHIFLFKM